MMMKISVERLLVESSKLQDHRQQSCVIRNGSSTLASKSTATKCVTYCKKLSSLVEDGKSHFRQAYSYWPQTSE